MLQWSGLQQALDFFDLSTEKIDNIVRKSLEEMAYEVLKLAKKQTPVDTGNLMGSGEVEERDNAFVVKFTADYAAHVHESTDIPHDNGKAKFLEDAVEVIIDKPYALDVVTKRINDELNLS